ncbi:MAG: hypothetical protein ABI551_03790, partial [Polyangiaceae bacterium]
VAGELGLSADGGATTQSATPIVVAGVTGALTIAAGGLYPSSSYDYGVTCAVMSTGPQCWGSNQYGMLGRGDALANDALPHPAPAPVTGLTSYVDLTLGQTHACANTAAGVMCWGYNEYQGLGAGPLDGGVYVDTPVQAQLPGGKKALAISNGFGHTCAVLEDRTVACWGYNAEGSCGVPPPAGGTTYTQAPIVVPGISNAAHVASGSYHSCVTTTDGALWCWGYNYQGSIGVAGDGGYVVAPVQIAMPDSHKAANVVAGTYTTCALLDDGTVACWGNDTYGQAGVALDAATTGVVPTPTIVSGVGKVRKLAMGSGGQHVCALVYGGSVKCWGMNELGQLGVATSEGGTAIGTSTNVPVDVQF